MSLPAGPTGPNLARRPFVNDRPATRLALLLWGVAALLVGLNLYFFWGYFSGFGHRSDELASVEEKIRDEERRARESSAMIAGLDLDSRNEQVAYLNSRIDERAFSWSHLFEELGEVLPRQVRIYSLSPLQNLSPSGGEDTPARRVSLRLVGAAESDEALIELLDRLFTHPAFDSPNLRREARKDPRFIEFGLDVVYFPAVRSTELTGRTATIAEDGGTTGAAPQVVEAAPGVAAPPGAGTPTAPPLAARAVTPGAAPSRPSSLPASPGRVPDLATETTAPPAGADQQATATPSAPAARRPVGRPPGVAPAQAGGSPSRVGTPGLPPPAVATLQPGLPGVSIPPPSSVTPWVPPSSRDTPDGTPTDPAPTGPVRPEPSTPNASGSPRLGP